MITPTKNSTSSVILFGIVVLGLIVGYFYYAQVLQDQSVDITSFTIPPEDNLVKFKDLTFDFGPFDDLKFKSLKIFGESPVLPGATGRVDIFAPF